MSVPIDIDEQMLKVMEVTTHCEDGGSWKNVTVKRNGYNRGISTKDWHPSTNIQDAMDIIERFTEPGESARVELFHNYRTDCWEVSIYGEHGYASTLPMAICCTVLKIIEKKEKNLEPAEQEEE